VELAMKKKESWLEVEILHRTCYITPEKLKLVTGFVNCFVAGGRERTFDELDPRGYFINLAWSNVRATRDGRQRGSGDRNRWKRIPAETRNA